MVGLVKFVSYKNVVKLCRWKVFLSTLGWSFLYESEKNKFRLYNRQWL